MTRITLSLVGVLCFLAGFAFSQDGEYERLLELTNAATNELLEPLAFVAANKDFCATYAPAYYTAVKDAADHWYVGAGLGVFYTLARVLSNEHVKFAALLHRAEQEQFDVLYTQLGSQAEAWCSQLPALLSKPEWQFAQQEGQLAHLRNIDAYIRYLGDAVALPPAWYLLNRVPWVSYLSAKASGINPDEQLLPDEFRCYMELTGRDYNFPDLLLQVLPNGRYYSSYGEGTYSNTAEDYGDVRFTSGVLAPTEDIYVNYNRYGQSFDVEMRLEDYGYYEFTCYQQGPREAQALVDYALQDPQAGSYPCFNVNTGDKQILELRSNYTYSWGAQEGTYYPTGVMRRSDDITFLTGPLEGRDADYWEDYPTGQRNISMSIEEGIFFLGTGGSSSSLDVSCSLLAEKRPLARYGPNPAPPPPVGAGGLSGFYYRESSDSNGNPRFYFRYFLPEGYVYMLEPEGDPSRIDCSRTWPSGEPVCSTYTVSGNSFRYDNGEVLSFGRDGQTLHIGNSRYTPVPQGVPLSAGAYSGLRGSVSYDLMGGSSSLSRLYYTFSPDGRFLRGRSSDSTIGAGMFGNISTFASSSSSSSNAGNFYMSGNLLTLNYDDGRSYEKFFLPLSERMFYIDGFVMTLDD